MEFSGSLNYENTIEHVLVQDHKIHESVLYQELFCLFFELSKNEEGPEFAFLDLLNLYKKEGKGISFTCILHHGSKSCFFEQRTIFESINTWVLVFFILSRFRFFYSFSWFIFQLYGESVNVSYIAYLCRWSFLCQKPPNSIFVACSLFKD